MLRYAKKSVEVVLVWIGTVLGGLYLMTLYGLTIWIAVGSLAAIQVRANLSEDEKALTFTDVEAALNSYNSRVGQIYQNVNSLYDYAQQEQNRYLIPMQDTLRDLAGELNIAVGEDQLSPYSMHPDLLAKIDACNAPGPLDGSNACGLVAQYMSLLEDSNKLDLSTVYRDIEVAEAETQAKLDSLRTSEPLFQHFAAYNFFNDVMGLSRLLTVPSEILVLVVTMAMGILGSVVTMTWLFIHNDNTLTLRRFIVLPFIGAISAFIIFIFVSAGQLTLTAGDANDSLNPYVLSFIGVISGLLSERAYTRISAVGTSFFDVDDRQPRWGSRIREAMDAAGVTEPELARYLGVSEEESTRIVNESTTATLEQQRLIAACLRRTVRELFTDVPPDGPATIAAAPGVDVPDLTGLDAPGLERALAEAGLRIGAVAETAAEGAPPGVVVAQSPAPGERLPRGATVEITRAAPAADPGEPAS